MTPRGSHDARRGAKWADVPPGAIASSVADMELDPPGVVLDAARSELDRAPGYSSPAEVRAPMAAGAAWLEQRHGLRVDVARCVPISSVAAAATWVVVRTTAPGDGVVRIRPTYPPLAQAVRDAGRDDRVVDLGRHAGTWRMDLDELDRTCRGARLLLWVSPHNPTGRVWSRDELRDVAVIAARHGLSVVADEVWADVLLGDAVHVPFATVAAAVDPALAERTITFASTTKTWNLAGLGCGLMHPGSAALHRVLRGTGHVPMVPTPGRVALAAANAAWRHGRPWLEETLRLIEGNRDLAVTWLTERLDDERVTRPEGTYLLWLDLRGLVEDDDVVAALGGEGGVVPTDGASYGTPGFVRLNLAAPTTQVEEVVRRVLTRLCG